MTGPEVATVRIKATRWVSDEPNPGVVEIELRDASGRIWKFEDKAPMFEYSEVLTAETHYPVDLELPCSVLRRYEVEGETFVEISTRSAGVEAVDGTFVFIVKPQQIIDR